MKTALFAFTSGAGLCQALGALVAQAEPLSGGAGWVGAGLLGLVLAWVLGKQIPDERRNFNDMLTAKDAQITALIESRDKLAKDMSAENAKAIAAVSGDNKESIREITAAHRESVKSMIDAVERRHQENVAEQREERAERQQQFNALMAAVAAEFRQVHADAKEGRHETKGVLQAMRNWLAVFRHLVPGLKDMEEDSPS